MTTFTHLKLFILLVFFGAVTSLQAQDTTAIESGAESSNTATTAPKPKERFKINVDTATELVTYKAVVDQMDTDADSFYVRAKKWADKKYNLAGNRKMILLDKPNEKIVINTKFDAYTSGNQFSKNVIGEISFTLTLIVRESKFKYIIDNIKYVPYQDPETVSSLKPSQYEGVETFEFLQARKYKSKDADNLLKCSDKEFQSLIAEIKRALKNPQQVDEDEF